MDPVKVVQSLGSLSVMAQGCLANPVDDDEEPTITPETPETPEANLVADLASPISSTSTAPPPAEATAPPAESQPSQTGLVGPQADGSSSESQGGDIYDHSKHNRRQKLDADYFINNIKDLFNEAFGSSSDEEYPEISIKDKITALVEFEKQITRAMKVAGARKTVRQSCYDKHQERLLKLVNTGFMDVARMSNDGREARHREIMWYTNAFKRTLQECINWCKEGPACLPSIANILQSVLSTPENDAGQSPELIPTSPVEPEPEPEPEQDDDPSATSPELISESGSGSTEPEPADETNGDSDSVTPTLTAPEETQAQPNVSEATKNLIKVIVGAKETGKFMVDVSKRLNKQLKLTNNNGSTERVHWDEASYITARARLGMSNTKSVGPDSLNKNAEKLQKLFDWKQDEVKSVISTILDPDHTSSDVQEQVMKALKYFTDTDARGKANNLTTIIERLGLNREANGRFQTQNYILAGLVALFSIYDDEDQ